MKQFLVTIEAHKVISMPREFSNDDEQVPVESSRADIYEGVHGILTSKDFDVSIISVEEYSPALAMGEIEDASLRYGNVIKMESDDDE